VSLERTGVRYRADIDGLRAVAVAAVVFYHAKVPGFSGGYVGVDIFFVISGFLITQVLDVPAAGTWTSALGRFYLRRARRILPALLAMLVMCAMIAVALYLPADLKKFGRSLMLAVAFLGNYGAVLNGGYFDPGERFTPLRHLWSIGVEEQFYLFYPLFLLVVNARLRAARSAMFGAIALLSLLVASWGAIHAPVLNFFMLPTRAWELLVGALLAVNPQLFRGTPRTNQALATIGLAGLVVVFWYARVISFPGPGTVGASVCTALLIIGNSAGSTIVARTLSWRPIVFTGLISFSLYLYHAPILAFFSYAKVRDPTTTELCLILLSTYLLAAGSWVAIEQPFRTRAVVAAPSVFLLATLALSAALALFGYWMVSADGLPQRWKTPLPTVAADSPELSAFAARCSASSLQSISAGDLCSFGPQNESAKKVVVWGDSHAGALLPTYQSLAVAEDLRIYFGIKGACWPLVGSEAASSGEFWRARCAKFNTAMVQAIRHLDPQLVILNAYWLDPGAPTEPELRRRTPQTQSAMVEGIRHTLEEIRAPGRTVCAVLTVPGYAYPIPYFLAMADRGYVDPDALTVTRAEALRQYQTVEGALRLLASQNELRVVDPKDLLCPGKNCLTRTADRELLYRDANHLSVTGARFLTGVLDQCLADLHKARN
jgi:peptidoglycan/LPS O-acetylase OafA/YrhL